MVQKHLNHKNECHTVSLVWHFFSKGEEKAEKKYLFFLMVIFFFITSSPVKASELNFGVEAELPVNQKDVKKTYFDLSVMANQIQTVYILLTNNTNKPVTVEPQINEAKTNNNGNVQYDKNTIKRDSQLKKIITDYVKVQRDIVIPPNDSVRLPIEIKIPKEGFEGILLGGILLQQKSSELDEVKEAKEGLGIKNNYAYVVAIQLDEKNEAIKPELGLNEVKANQKNYRNVITASLQNKTPVLINQLEVKAEIFKNKQLLYTHERKTMQMAPMSNFEFSIPLQGKELKPGKYILEMEANSLQNHWRFTKEFEIKSNEAKQLNSLDVTIKKDDTWFIVGFVLFCFLLCFILVLILKKKK